MFAGLLLAFGLLAPSLWATTYVSSRDDAVIVTATPSLSPLQIQLTWGFDYWHTEFPPTYTVQRKSRNATSWSAPVAAGFTGWTDTNVVAGQAYEYRVTANNPANTTPYTGYGYIYAAIDFPMVDHRGTVVLIVESGIAAATAGELTRLKQDLVGDGWTVIRHDVAVADTVTSVKALIKADYLADPTQVKSVFLFGHVPQPRSGFYAPDGHGDHQIQQPCDSYYGDMDGTWTDTANYGTNGAWTNNAGDGYFDQNFIPSDIELGVGRVDLSNMWAFSANEPALLRQYLDKDHNFRQRIVTMNRGCLIQDGFDSGGGIGSPAASAWRLSGIIGSYASNNFVRGQWVLPNPTDTTGVPRFPGENYLWGYVCGGGGPYGMANGSLTTQLLAANSVNIAFTMSFGSYFGDWSFDNDFMRAVLASSPAGLSCSWSGWPQHHYFHMGLGEPIGNSIVVSQNNDGNLYSSGGFNWRAVHIGLMGDPTLIAFPVIPPTGLSASAAGSTVTLTWSASAEATLGYHVFRATNIDGPYARLTTSPTTATSYSDTSLSAGTYAYLVRAAKMEMSPSGTFVNLSGGVLATVTVSGGVSAPVVSSAGTATATVGQTFSYTITASNSPTSFGATGLPAGLTINTATGVISGTPTASGTATVTISATNAAGTGSKTLTLTVNAAPPVAPVVSSAGTATATVGQTFSYTITASNSPTSFGATGLPAGLTINTATGVISGTPTASGTATVTISATNAAGTGSKTLTLTVNAAVPVVTSAGSATATVGQGFTYSITASNVPTSYGATGLPSGLTVNTGTGVISGTPTAAGTATVTIRAINSAGTGTKTLTITVNPAVAGTPVIGSPGTAVGTLGQPFSYTITATNTPTSYGATGLPTGLSVNTTTGVISGTPTAAGTYTITIQATNGSGTSSTSMALTIQATTSIIDSEAGGASGGTHCGMGAGLGALALLLALGQARRSRALNRCERTRS
ncbi:MAG: putative Ig domain-containing protein [Planctomycetes bacterium]|nr:putative Ig domain-containing protein [Planctomycetota bacterium]